MPTSDDTQPDPAARVRQLLLSGDNIIKNRDDDARFERARTRFAQARQVAIDAGLDPGIVLIIDRRLETLPE